MCNSMSKEYSVNLSKQSLPQLQELLERQDALIRNRKLLEHLKDKGESVKRLRDKIQTEIQHRKDIKNVEDSLAALTLRCSESEPAFLKEKHVEYVCSKDKPTEDTRYRPHRTLFHKETKTSPEKSPKKFTEVTAAFEPKLIYEPTKCIPLSESLTIQSEQAQKLLEERVKRTFNSFVMDEDESDSNNESNQDLQNEAFIEDS